MNFLKNNWYYLPLVFLCILYVYKSYHFQIHDYANYYFGGLFLQEGIFDSAIYFPYHFNKTIASFGYQNIFVSYAPNTPFLAIFFWLFSFLEIGFSKLLFNSISTVLFVIAIYRLATYYKINKNYILLIPMLFFIPIKNNLLFGQVYFLLFFLLSEGFLAYQKKQYKILAIYWGLAIFLKVFPILFVLFLVVKKKYKATIYVGISCIFLLIFSILITGLDTWLFYISSVIKRANNGEIAGSFVDNYQSFFMFCKRLFVFDATYNSNPVLENPKLFYGFVLFLKLIVLSISIFITRNNKNNIISFTFWALASILMSPYGSTYSFLILLFLFFTLANKNVAFKHKNIAFLFLFLISNSTILPKLVFPFNYLRLFFLIIFFMALVWHFRKQIPLKKLGIAVFFLSVGITVFKEEKNNFKTVVKTPILTYDYQLKNDKIHYYFWNENGENQLKKEFNYKKLDSTNVQLIGNQIYYKNTQITFDNSNKKKPIIIDNKKVIFLSDAATGIGFYSIRKLDL